MRPLWPGPQRPALGPEEIYASEIGPAEGQPWVRVNMICTLDGALVARGRAGPISGPPDRRAFAALRGLADVVLVGAGTARTEGYGRVELSPAVREARRQRGQQDLPPLAVVSRSGHLPWTGRLAAAPGPRPLLFVPPGLQITGRPDDDQGPEVIGAGAAPGHVDLRAVMAELYHRGWHHVLCEGGPSLNASLAAGGLVDELCVTLSPKLAGHIGGSLLGGWLGSGERWLEASGAPAGTELLAGGDSQAGGTVGVVDLRLHSVYEEEGFLFLRLKKTRSGTAVPPDG